MRTWAAALVACGAVLMCARATAGSAGIAEPEGGEASPRFQLSGSVVPSTRDAGGRFELQGQARYAAEPKGKAERFTLKSTTADCGLLNDLFADGFEDPPP